MKKNDQLLITATLAYSYLFYGQTAGINFLLFDVIMITVLLLRDASLFRNPRWLWASALLLVSGASVFIHSSALAILANCFSLLLVSAFAFSARTSAIFAFLFAVFSICSAFVYMILDALKRKAEQLNQVNRPWQRWIAASLVFVLCIVFFSLYQSANPLFAENTKWINLDFLSLRWLAFTFGGFLLVYPLFYHKVIPMVERWENNLNPVNVKLQVEAGQRPATERMAGLFLFGMLNLMLLVLNAGDIHTIWLNGKLPAGLTHSDFVHHGVGMIIFSILIAVSLIMFLYRKDFRGIPYAGLLKFLIYLWIAQNLLMLASTAWRNQLYIQSFSLTYKRIGVYVWLGLAVFGLLILFAKVLKERSNWYLVRSNFALWFTVLSLSALLNWDLLITRYNLSLKPAAQVDHYYLLSLSDTNIPELLELAKDPAFLAKAASPAHYIRRDEHWQNAYIPMLRDKIFAYLRDHCSDWQSFDLRDQRILKSLNQHL